MIFPRGWKRGPGSMAQAVMDGQKGQLATVKCLFEVASICPPSTDGSRATGNEGCLATTLLPRLNIKDEPIRRDEEDEPERRARDQSRGA
jgi:hypothetical protein